MSSTTAPKSKASSSHHRSAAGKGSTGSPRSAKAAEPKLSRQRRPETMTAADWQRELRRQFGREQRFGLELREGGPVFGLWRVVNPAGGGRYLVTLRGSAPGDNHCTCQDFATNDLGTCKHIEFVLHRLQARRGSKAAFARGFTQAASEVRLQRGPGPISTLRFHPGSGCPAELRQQVQALCGLGVDVTPPWELPLLHGRELDGLATAAAQAGHPLQWQEAALRHLAQWRDAEQRRHRLDKAYPGGAEDPALARLLKTRLYPYQAEGALFAARAGRVLIGDEMGLGKTVQAIAAAELMARHFGVQRVLVVCPTSLKHQWQREIQRFTGRPAQVLQGLRAQRQQQWQWRAAANAEPGEGSPAEDDAAVQCKIVNYETLVRDADLAEVWAPELLIVDEAQRVKNWNTQAARALKRLADPALCPCVVVLTGTPLENRLEELISIVQVVDQHRLGPTWRLLHEHQQVDDAGRVIGYRDLDRIGNTLAPILLRRRKAEVLTQLPARVDQTLFVPLTAEQRAHHDENGLIVSRIVQRWRKTGWLSDTDQRRLQCALQNMRMACNSTWLLDHETDHGHKADELLTLLDELFEQPGAKAVVFSQWLGTHEVLLRRLAERAAQQPAERRWRHVFFHGGVPAEQRGVLVERFHIDPNCRLFLSTDAGSTGLNLQHAAAVVVNMDLPWNPALLEQRIGRVHRLGQSRGVQVINLVAQGSIEEGMLSVLAFKTSLFKGVLDGGDGTVFMEGTRLSRFMKSVDAATAGMGVAEAATEVTSAPTLPAGEGPAAMAQEEVLDAAVNDGAPVGGPATDLAARVAAEVLIHPTHGPSGLPSGTLTSNLAAQSNEAQPAPPATSGVASATDPWAPLLQVGLQLLQTLARQEPAAPGSPGQSGAERLVHTDEAGQRYLKLPLPEPQAVQRLAEALTDLLGTQRR